MIQGQLATEPQFKGKQGNQKTEIHFDPATRTMTIKLLVQDPNGYFIPNIRRENFVVDQNGVRQQNATVEIEHAPVSLGLLMEFGGRSPGLNRDLGEEVSRACQHVVDELGQDDSMAAWKYNKNVQNLSGFSRDKMSFESLCPRLDARAFVNQSLRRGYLHARANASGQRTQGDSLDFFRYRYLQ